MVKNNSVKRTLSCAALVLALVFCFSLSAFAAKADCESAVATGLYRHPVTGAIEDSGGESSEALGQSMVTSVVDPSALLETAADGSLWLSVRFNLMSNISDVKLHVQKPGQTDWTPVDFESTAKGADTEDLRLPFPSKDSILRAECFVDAMGRAVVFYVTLDDFTPGNSGGFVQMDADAAPAAGTGVQPSGNRVSGLVTGGENSVSVQAAAASDGSSVPVYISGRVWVMFFILVFCAQLLACLAFWGLKTLVQRGRDKRAQPSGLPAASPYTDEDGEFDADFGDMDWEDDNERP